MAKQNKNQMKENQATQHKPLSGSHKVKQKNHSRQKGNSHHGL
ncbi:MAG: small acid-soluble spore protein P [Caldibacillus sp.]